MDVVTKKRSDNYILGFISKEEGLRILGILRCHLSTHDAPLRFKSSPRMDAVEKKRSVTSVALFSVKFMDERRNQKTARKDYS